MSDATPEPIRVVLAEDHVMVRAGIERLLAGAPDIEIVGLAANGREAVDIATASGPDVVVMDLSMPELDGVAATRELVTARPEVRVLVLTSFMDPRRIVDAIDAGAVGYLLKDAEPDELVRGIRAASRGEMPLDPRVTRALLERRGSAAPSGVVELTEREQEVLNLVADGLANKAIARRLGISEKTVKNHLSSVFDKLGVNDRLELALYALEKKLLE